MVDNPNTPRIKKIGVTAGSRYCPSQCSICGTRDLDLSFNNLVDGFSKNREAYDYVIRAFLESGIAVCFSGADEPALHLEDITRSAGFESAYYLITGKILSKNNPFVRDLQGVNQKTHKLQEADRARLDILKREYCKRYPTAGIEIMSNPAIYISFENKKVPSKADLKEAKRKVKKEGVDPRTLVSIILNSGFGVNLSLGASQSHDSETYRKSLDFLDFLFDWLGITLRPSQLEAISEDEETDRITREVLGNLSQLRIQKLVIKRPLAVGRYLKRAVGKPRHLFGVCELERAPLGIYTGMKDNMPWLRLYCSSVGSNFLVHQDIMPLEKVLEYKHKGDKRGFVESVHQAYEGLLQRPGIRLMRQSMGEWAIVVGHILGDRPSFIFTAQCACEGCYQIAAKVRKYLEEKGMIPAQFTELVDKEIKERGLVDTTADIIAGGNGSRYYLKDEGGLTVMLPVNIPGSQEGTLILTITGYPTRRGAPIGVDDMDKSSDGKLHVARLNCQLAGKDLIYYAKFDGKKFDYYGAGPLVPEKFRAFPDKLKPIVEECLRRV